MARRPGSNRGFKAPRRGGVQNPQIQRTGYRGRALPGAPPVPPAAVRRIHIYPNVPSDWLYSEGEWIVHWYLTERRRFEEGKDFYHQSRIFAPYLFSNRNFTQADFIVDLGPRSKLGPIGNFKALVLDPFADFTHNYDFDMQRKRDLDLQRYRLVFLDIFDLENRTEEVIERALGGEDLSSRGPS